MVNGGRDAAGTRVRSPGFHPARVLAAMGADGLAALTEAAQSEHPGVTAIARSRLGELARKAK